MEIVTGSTGVKHVTPIDDAIRNGNTAFLTDKAVFNVFRNFEAVARTANEVRVYGGYGINQGRIFKIDENEFDSVIIDSIENTSFKRKDLIVARYSWNSNSGVENISLAVVKGEEGTEYVTPTHFTGDINSGNSETVDDFPLYAVYVDGIRIDHVEALFTALPIGGRLGEVNQRLGAHMNNVTDPHRINWSIANTLTDLAASDNLAVLFGKIAKAVNAIRTHISNTSNPHNVKGSQLVVSNDSEAVPISKGGTGATTAQQAIENLGLPTEVADCASKTFFMGEAQTAVLVEKGGTGKTSHTSGRVLIGNGTGPFGERSIDTSPTANSTNLITSGAVKTALDGKMATKTIDTTPKSGSSNLITSGAVYKAVPTFSLSGTTLTITTH